MKCRGFTIVELSIVITIMAILLVMGVVNLRDAQANGYDAERKSDIESIASHLETFYSSGTDQSTETGRYPSTVLVASSSNMTSMLRDIDLKLVTAPDPSSTPTTTFIAATCTDECIQTTAGVTPQPTINQYVYQPIQSDGTLCIAETQECRKFNLYYRLQVDNTVYMVTSKNQ